MISKEEFYYRAVEAPVSPDNGDVIRLSIWIYAPDTLLLIESGGCYKVVKDKVIDFNSRHRAEEVIQYYVGIHNNVYRFIISEIPMTGLANGEIRNEWVYDGKGRLIDNSLASMHHYDHGKFYGRPYERIRFKPGDLVEWFDGDDTVTLGVVVGLPPTIEHCWERMKQVFEDKHFADVPNKEEAYIYDFTDDCYTVIDTPDYMASHEHVAAHYVAIPSIPVTQELRERYAKVYKEYVLKLER